jgi:HAD superfamily hydrolase (TIGR01549 family)
MKPIETVLFDFGGTLDANGIAWKERFYALYRAEGLQMSPDAFQPVFFAADSLLVGNLCPRTDLAGTVHALVANIEIELADRSQTGNAAAGNGRSKRVASRFLSGAAAAFARNRPVLEELRQRCRLGVVSNFYGNLEAVCRGARLASLFSALVDSHCVGAEKPDPKIFQAALQTLGAQAETTLLVGDSLRRDGEGARRMGMRFIWMAPHCVPGAEHGASTELPIEHSVTELHEMMRILQ